MSIREILELSSDDILKLVFIGFSGSFVPFTLIIAGLTLYQVIPVTFRDEPCDGAKGSFDCDSGRIVCDTRVHLGIWGCFGLGTQICPVLSKDIWNCLVIRCCE